jgi:hypothetical protein
MNPIQATAVQTHRKPVKIGIPDLIAKKPTYSLYAKMMNPNFASIMPQVVGGMMSISSRIPVLKI